MGIYDDVKFEMECPNCKNKVNDFQSKDGACRMHTLDFWEVNNFYSSCPHCNTWIEFTIKQRPNRRLTIKDYHKEIQIPTKKEQAVREEGHKKLAKFFANRIKSTKGE